MERYWIFFIYKIQSYDGSCFSFSSCCWSFFLSLLVGFLKVEDAITPNLGKLSPIEGFKRVFSMKALFEGLKSILKMLAVGVIVYFLLKNEVQQIPWMSDKSIPELIVYIGKLIVKLLGGIGGLLLVIAGVDYFFQTWYIRKTYDDV